MKYFTISTTLHILINNNTIDVSTQANYFAQDSTQHHTQWKNEQCDLIWKKQIRILLITSNPPKLLINSNGRALQQQIAPMLSRENGMDVWWQEQESGAKFM